MFIELKAFLGAPAKPGDTAVDPMYAMQWQFLAGGANDVYNLNNWVFRLCGLEYNITNS